MPDEQSTTKFLFSKEGRGILIGTIILIMVVVAIGVWTADALFGGNETNRSISAEQREKLKEQTGETRVQADSTNIRANVTSQNMTAEARGVLNDYNKNADEFGLMPVPTPENVATVPVGTGENNNEAQDEKPANIATETNERRSPPETMQREQLSKAEREARKEVHKRAEQLLTEQHIARLEAAKQLLAVYSKPPTNASIAFADYDKGVGDKGNGELARVSRNKDGTASFHEGDKSGSGNQCTAPLIKGGEIRYAQTDIALNTDFKGPVRMTFLDGEIAGYIGMGSFELNELGARMKLKIDRLFGPDGQEYEVSGYVLDPDTTLWAMASDVDHHIIYRYGGFGLATILSSFSKLAEIRAVESQITTTDGTQATNYREPDSKQVTWTMLGEFSRLFEEAFKDNLDRPITVTLDAQEEAGVLFESTVCEIDSKITRKRKAEEQRAAAGFTDPVEG